VSGLETSPVSIRKGETGMARKKRGVLAINGGPKSITKDERKIFRWPDTGKEEIAAATRLLKTSQLSFSEDADILVKEFTKLTGTKYGVCTVNGTAAGHECFFAINIRPGDEIIAPSFTYWATILQALYWGGVPVFAEMDPKTLNIDPNDIEHRITKRTKAIVVVHMLGLPCEMDPIMKIARKYKLKVIEDASHAHGATYKGQPVGSFGDVSFFSMQSSKLMPAGEGGIFVTKEKEYYHRALALGHYALNRRAGSEYSRFLTGLGFKYRVHPIAAAIGLCQLRKLKEHTKPRARNVQHLLKGLKKMKCWDIMETPKHVKHVWYENWQAWRPEAAPGVTKEKFLAALQAEGCRVVDMRYNLLHQQDIFTDATLYSKDGIFPWFANIPNKPLYRGDELPISAAHREKLVSLPTFPNGTIKDVERHLAAFKKVEDNLDELKD